MNLSPTLQKAIEQLASIQGISSEQFIVQTLVEKISSLQTTDSHLSLPHTGQTGLREQDGLLVFDTKSLDHIDFKDLIAQRLEKRAFDQMGL